MLDAASMPMSRYWPAFNACRELALAADGIMPPALFLATPLTSPAEMQDYMTPGKPRLASAVSSQPRPKEIKRG